jgi:nucleoside-diphosphate-sugar epimerase
MGLLKDAGISPFLISAGAGGTSGNTYDFLNGSEILIIDIPTKFKGPDSESFVARISGFLPFIEQSAIKKVIFVSSISVYGNNNSVITETKLPEPDTDSGKQLWAAEQLLQKNNHFHTMVLRLAGLIGEDRHPVYFLAGKENLENPEAPVNLIHQNDCIGIIVQAVRKGIPEGIFNAATPFHPTREAYYTQKAADLKLPALHFNRQRASAGKVIDSEKLQRLLDYQFQVQKL